jgi:SAM-dependent methyltransferase
MFVYKEAAKLSSSSSDILDVGTKDGRFLSEVDGNVTAIDVELSPSVDGPSFLFADGCQMPFENDSFDTVISNQVYEHISPEQREEMTDEIVRVLRPNGEFLISIPNRYFPLGGTPHGLPMFWTFLPKSIGLKLAQYMVDDQDYEYYNDNLFPIAPWGLRALLEKRFKKVEYSTLELGKRFGDEVWPEWFNSMYPLIYRIASYPGLRTAFEWSFGYVSYKAQLPELASD